jgi:hypothetical protein
MMQSFNKGVNPGAQSSTGTTRRLVAFFSGSTRRVPVRPHDGAVDEYFLKISILGQYPENLLPDALFGPAGETLIDAVPASKPFRQIAPGTACSRDPQHRFKEAPVVSSRAPRIPFLSRQERLDASIWVIPQNYPNHSGFLCKKQDITRKRNG